MYNITVPNSDLRVSRLIFGTASLFRMPRQRERLNVLSAAVDIGITHFDTAPLYGFGWAERDLGALIVRHRNVSVTTKVGLYPPGGADQQQAFVFGRKVLGRIVGRLSRPAVEFEVSRARNSLDASLRRLGVERVAALMLHDPSIELVSTDEWLRWLENEVRNGRVARFGISSTIERIQPFVDAVSPLASLLQIGDSLEHREADYLTAVGRPLQITFGYVSSALRLNSGIAVEAVLRKALARNSEGAIIVSTSRPDRLRQLARLVSEEV